MHFLLDDDPLGHYVLPLTISDAERLLEHVNSTPVPAHLMAAHLGYFELTTIGPETHDAIEIVASRFSPAEIKITDVAKVATADGTFICICAVLDSNALSELNRQFEEALSEAGIPVITNTATDYHIPLSLSEDSSAVDSVEILRHAVLIEEFQIWVGDEVHAFALGGQSEGYYIAEDTDNCDGYAILRSDDREMMSCHESETEAQDALDRLLQEEGGKADESLINLSSKPVHSEGTTMTMLDEPTIPDMPVADPADCGSCCDDCTEGETCVTEASVDETVITEGTIVVSHELEVSVSQELLDARAAGTITEEQYELGLQTEIEEASRLLTEAASAIAENPSAVEELATDGETEVEVTDEVLEALEPADLDITPEPAQLGVLNQLMSLGMRLDNDEFETVLVVEELPTGDGRLFARDAFSFREGALPLMFNKINTGHEASVVAGVITKTWKVEADGYVAVMGRGVFDKSEAGIEAKRMISEGMLKGISVDMDSVRVADIFQDDEGYETFVFSQARIMGATLLPFPAFQEAGIWVLEHEEEALLASGGELPQVRSVIEFGDANDACEYALVASGAITEEATSVIPARPPKAWFNAKPAFNKAYPIQFEESGLIHGYLAGKKSVHIGFLNRTVKPPKSTNEYAYFRSGTVLCEDGSKVATGRLTIDTVHPKLAGKAFNEVSAFYDDTGSCVGDVVIRDTDEGIYVCGAIRPDVSDAMIRRARGSGFSGDWRNIDGQLNLVAALGVNLAGFPLEGLVASGAIAENDYIVPGENYVEFELGEETACSLIGCFSVNPEQTEIARIDERLQALESMALAFRKVEPELNALAVERLLHED